ncbi:MAG: hypothetical protein SW833_15965 [Cyanobacteriota bacterium]|nr:hypothetical protein [Cyanobacteriota bacterium]
MSEQHSYQSFQCIYELRPFKYEITSLAISSDGQILASSEGISVQLFALPTGQLIRTLKKRGGGASRGLLFSLAISLNNQIIAGACEKYSIYLWNLSTGEQLGFLRHVTYFNHDYTSIAFCADNATLISGGSAITDSWDIRTQKYSLGPNSLGERLALSPNGHTFVGDLSRVEFSQIGRARKPHRIEKLSACVATVAITNDGKTCAAGLHDGKIQFWDWQTYGELLAINAHTDIVCSIAFSRDGQTLVSGSNDKLIKFWNVTNGQLLGTLEGHQGRVYGVAWSPDGRFLASYDSKKTIKVWRIG